MADAQEIGAAVAEALAANDPATRREAAKRAANDWLRKTAQAGKVSITPDGETVPLTGQGLDQGSRGAAPIAPDPNQQMNDWLRGRGGDDE